MSDIERAIKSLKNIIEYWTSKPTEVKACEIAIEALEKQMPKKVAETRARFQVNEYCPSCGAWIRFEKIIPINYCFKCGQKLDWSGEE